MCPEETFKNYLKLNGKVAQSKFIESLIKPIKTHKFDGLDMHFRQLEDSLLQITQMSPKREKFFEMLRGIKKALKQNSLYITSSFAVSLDFASRTFNVSDHVDIFELFHIHQMDVDSGLLDQGFAAVKKEVTPWNVKLKIQHLVHSWGIPAHRIVLSSTLCLHSTHFWLSLRCIDFQLFFL